MRTHRRFDVDIQVSEILTKAQPAHTAPMEEHEAYAEQPYEARLVCRLVSGMVMGHSEIVNCMSNRRHFEYMVDRMFQAAKVEFAKEFHAHLAAIINEETWTKNQYEHKDESPKGEGS